MTIVPNPGPQTPESSQVADLVASAACSVPGVTGLHSGTFGAVATYLPGRRVEGVRVGDDTAEVHVILSWGSPVLATAQAVRQAVRPLVDTAIDVYVEDVQPVDLETS